MPEKSEKVLSFNSHWVTFSIAAVLVIAPIAAGSSAKAADFIFIQIDAPGATSTNIRGINDAGQIVGSFSDSTGTHGFLDIGGSFTQIDMPGASQTIANGINDAGQIVGSFNFGSRGFLYSGGSFTQIGVPGADGTTAYGINNAGQIVGSAVHVSPILHGGFRFIDLSGFLYSGDSFTQFSVPSISGTTAYGINNAGQIVGSANVHGFLYISGSSTQIDVPSSFSTEADGINDAGQIVGSFQDGMGGHGFRDIGGSFTQIDVPGSFHTEADGINDMGQIVGSFGDSTGTHGFVATAIGDPHFTTYDGIHYDYQGIGDFLLTGSSVDKFEVQVRTKPTYEGSAVTFMSEAAATLCNHKVTFDIDRASVGGFVWLDNSPLSLSVGGSRPIGDGCELLEISSNDYRLIWNTGEMLDVTNQGTYLDLSTQLSPLDLLGPMEGLLSSELDPDRWRVTGAASLFDPVPEPGTLTLLASALAGLAIIRRRAISPKPC